MFLAVVQANNTVTVDELEKIHVSSELRYAPDNEGGGRRRWSLTYLLYLHNINLFIYFIYKALTYFHPMFHVFTPQGVKELEHRLTIMTNKSITNNITTNIVNN